MIYRVVLDDTIDLHTSDINCMLLNPSLDLEMNSAGSFNFTLPPSHPYWNDIKVLKSTIDVYEDGDLIFTGRIASIEKNWNNERVVQCEGALAYFNDSIHRQMKWETPLPIASEDPTVHNFLKDILDNHNVFEGAENANRHIFIGNITVDPEVVTREVNYDTTLDILTRMCIDTNGGYMSVRKDLNDGKLYLDWVKDFTEESGQPAQFGLNLLNFDTSLAAEDICTGVLARGAEVNEQTVMLNDVELVDETTYPDMSVTHYTTQYQDILWHREGVAKFGQVVQVHDFSDAQTAWKDGQGQIVANSLFEMAKKWLEEKNTKIETIEVEVAELAWLGEGMPKYKLGQIVELSDEVHMAGESYETRLLPMYKLSCDLNSGSKKVTLGTPPKKELTQISASNSDSSTLSSSGSSSGSGGSGEGEECRVHDVKVNGTSVVTDKIANVQVPTDTVTASQMAQAINTAVAPKANTADVNQALAQKQDNLVFNSQDAATAHLTKIKNGNEVYDIPPGTEVEANPTGAATSDLTKLKVGSDIYGIPSGGSTYTAGDYININNNVINVKQNKGDDVYSYKFITTSTSDYGPRVKIQRYINGVFQSEEIYNNDNVRVNPVTLDGLITFTYGNGGYYWQYTVLENSNQHNKNEVIKWYYTTVVDYEESFNIPQQDTSKNLVLKEELEEAIEEAQFNNLTMMSDYYSEDEQVVGRWTDGKPIYQKSIHFSSPVTVAKYGTSGTTIATIANIEQIVSSIYSTFQNGSSNEEKSLIFWIENNDIKASDMFSHQYYNGQFTDFTFQYTKTTDTPGSGPTKGNLIYLPTLYSEEEREVGVWTDGKPVYQKTISVTIPNASSGVVCNVNANVDYMINLHYHGLNDTDFYNANSSYTSAQFWYRKSDDTVQAANILDWMRGDTGYLTIQYTKTTDQPGSGTWTQEGQLAHHYSTSEKIVGTWIDGSTIYERTWDFGSSIPYTTSDTWEDTGITIPNGKAIYSGITLDTNIQTGEPNLLRVTHFYLNNQKVYIKFDVGVSLGGCKYRYITLQYTKTS